MNSCIKGFIVNGTDSLSPQDLLSRELQLLLIGHMFDSSSWLICLLITCLWINCFSLKYPVNCVYSVYTYILFIAIQKASVPPWYKLHNSLLHWLNLHSSWLTIMQNINYAKWCSMVANGFNQVKSWRKRNCWRNASVFTEIENSYGRVYIYCGSCLAVNWEVFCHLT